MAQQVIRGAPCSSRLPDEPDRRLFSRPGVPAALDLDEHDFVREKPGQQDRGSDHGLFSGSGWLGPVQL